MFNRNKFYISCQDSKILSVCLICPFTRFQDFLISRDTFPSSCFYAEIILMLKDIKKTQISFYIGSNTFSKSLLFILSTFFSHLFYSKAFYYEFCKCSSSLLDSSAISTIYTLNACAFLPLRQIHSSKTWNVTTFFSPVPQTVIICHWVFEGISHERQRLLKVLHYLSNLKYRISVLRQDFPVLFNRDSRTYFEDFRLESKTWCHNRKITFF